MELPYGSIELIKKRIKKFPFKKIKKGTPILITLPTPKQEMIAKEINMDIGTYYHFVHNLHIYNDKLGL